MSNRNESFPSVFQAAALLLAGYLFEYLVSAALYDAQLALGLDRDQTNALVRLLASGVLLALVMLHRRITYRDLFHSAQLSAIATLVLVVPPVMLLVPGIILMAGVFNALLEHLLPLSVWEEQAFASMVAGNLATVVSTCILAPMLEEMLFRGIILRAFLQQHQRWEAIAYSALFFGAAHLNIYQFVLAFWLGLLLGWLFERTRSLIPCIALHAAVNSWAVASEVGGKANANQVLSQTTATAWFLAGASALVGAILLRRLLAPRRPSDA
jgi:uncharacterized protein